MQQKLLTAAREMEQFLSQKLIPFWVERCEDKAYGGYLTCFDETGKYYGNGEKYIVTQCRMLWGFSYLLPFAREEDQARFHHLAGQGLEFLLKHFWDSRHGGFAWEVEKSGVVKENAKLIYGEGFAVYALSEHYLRWHEPKALEYAEKTFDLMQLYAADTLYGGYRENLEADWSPSPDGPFAGDRKSLDIHMHLMEAFTTLYEASGKEIHRRKLQEVTALIFTHMVDAEKGYGFNQFDLAFNKLPAININRTWNAERETNQTLSAPEDTTSYGHNVELSWLAHKAASLLGGEEARYTQVFRRLLDHGLQYGYDYEFGGMYRDGVADRPALVKDKEWWQNFEAMVGYINGYVLYGDERYAVAFLGLWEFVKTKFLNWDVGESRQLLSREGEPLVAQMGNPWKGIYHTGRALAECIKRLPLTGAKSL